MITNMPQIGAPGWLSRLGVQLLMSAQVVISQFVGSSPMSGSVLTAQSMEPASDVMSLPLFPSPADAHSHFVSQQ